MRVIVYLLISFLYFSSSYLSHSDDDGDSSSSDTELIDCTEFPTHFIWVGAPTKDMRGSMIGHDVVGPSSIAHQLRTQNRVHAITFWCLSDHEEYYREYFSQEAPEITVRALDSLISGGIQKNDYILTQLHHAFKSIEQKKSDDYYSSIMINTLKKNGFSLYLLAYYHGYILDTNVYPLNIFAGESSLIDFADFGDVTTMKGCSGHDYFCMFSPAPNMPNALELFQQWLTIPLMYCFPHQFILKRKPFLPTDIGMKKISFKSYRVHHEIICNFSHRNNFNLFKLLLDYFFSLKTVDELEPIQEDCFIVLENPSYATAKKPESTPFLRLQGAHSLLHYCIAYGHREAIDYLRTKGDFEHMKACYWCSLDQQFYTVNPDELEQLISNAD